MKSRKKQFMLGDACAVDNQNVWIFMDFHNYIILYRLDFWFFLEQTLMMVLLYIYIYFFYVGSMLFCQLGD